MQVSQMSSEIAVWPLRFLYSFIHELFVKNLTKSFQVAVDPFETSQTGSNCMSYFVLLLYPLCFTIMEISSAKRDIGISWDKWEKYIFIACPRGPMQFIIIKRSLHDTMFFYTFLDSEMSLLNNNNH